MRRVVHVMSSGHKSYRNELVCRKINHNDDNEVG